MEEIIERIKHLYTKEIWGCNGVEITAGTTGPKGGDSGHGGRTYLSITDLGGTDLTVRITDEYENKKVFVLSGGKLEIGLGGDSELYTFVQILEFALEKIKKEIY